MKNVHLIPTPNSSRILYFGNSKELTLHVNPVTFRVFERSTQNIYITSDEEIKDRDWCLSKFNEVILFGRSYNEKFYKKIILTDNQDLIADGVQEVPEDFLQWFVQNSSCEFVEVVKESFRCCHSKDIHCSCYDTSDQNSCSLFYADYKIIIPKEIDMLELGQIIPKEEYNYNGKDEILWISNNLQCKQVSTCYNSLSKKCVCPKEGLKDVSIDWSGFPKSTQEIIDEDFNGGLTMGQIEEPLYDYGLQRENTYNEEEVGEIVYNVVGELAKHHGIIVDGAKLNDLFQEFKK